ncbi:MAG TPA: PilZ domain-containing protein [Blastocatellia bacterium]|nr:PilZ domain-containing protein [Blastocatellia bacterium]
MINSGGLNSRNNGSGPLNTGKLISAHYLEIEYLLERVEAAGTHYQTLGIERSATNEEVIHAYQSSVSVLHPPYHKVRAAVPDEMLERVDQAFRKVSQAFSDLTDISKREQYDQSLNPRPRGTGTPRKRKTGSRSASEPKSKTTNKLDEPQSASESVEIKTAPEFRPVFTRSAAHETSTDRRRCDRFKLSVPIMVAGYGPEGAKWQEVTKTIDVSRIGVAVRMRKGVKHGLVVHVTLPLPAKLRSHGFSEQGYNMYAIVRRVEPLTEGFRVVGLEFIGAHPPTDYLHRPWATFRTQKWNGPERRREPREDRAEPVEVEYLDESMQPVAKEAAVTENVSASGARVRVKSAPPEIEAVRITNPKRGFNSLALVRNRYSATDGRERICLQFVDRKWPM